MPLVRIDIPAGKPADYGRAVGDVVYAALMTHFNVPANDRFQVITAHGPESLSIDPFYIGIARSADALIIQATVSVGRSVAMKQALYKAIADGLHEKLGLRREDVMINLVEVTRADWSFGNGVAQYVEMDAAAAAQPRGSSAGGK